MSYLPIHYITFKPLTSNHIPVIKEWLSSPELKANQNSLVSLDVFHHQEELLLNGFVGRLISQQRLLMRIGAKFGKNAPWSLAWSTFIK